ncbi:gametogenetin-binding protein 2-like isoform X2 [Dendroctonus ponderosae]|nr:gametogenetin-binding protein 2-like isoform X2 [Dendroctonus ponderosae]KAH1003209.1 hypothetical protein HUJ05_011144 [Dendroctonus ponderosae]
MSRMEKLPNLVDVYQPAKKLGTRQLPLVVDSNLTLVMDIKNSNIISDSQTLSNKELNEYMTKLGVLSPEQLKASLQISKTALLEVLNQSVPCVGCRRSVEGLYYQLLSFGHPTLDPIVVRGDGTITLRPEKHSYNVLANIFHDHAQRLKTLIDTQPKRNKKSVRCLLHSLDWQRIRPVTPVWRDIWNCMKSDCRKDICIIESACLYATLENYLRQHRFCGECRIKVVKAYTLLVEEADPSKEKGYVPALYSGIKRCLQDKHIHLNPKTEYITKLINRAEPELLGRERHAKTLEIAQEEVLTCLGICMYERLNRLYMRVREEERTCQLFAAVAVHTLHRSFETVVEKARGVSQLELLYEEFAREEQAKQKHKEAKKSRRKRRKGKALCEKARCEFAPDCLCPAPGKPDGVCECCSDDSDSREDALLDQSRCSSDLWADDCDSKELCKCDTVPDNPKDPDCDYSANNNCCESASLDSSLSSSPEDSGLACSDICCQPADFGSQCRLTCGAGLSLQEMLEGPSEDDEDCYITAEEVREFKSKSRQIYEKRRELRETLQKRFAQFCHNGPLIVPRLLVQTKYASN